MKTVIVALLLFMAFLVCYEKDLFVLSYGLFGVSLALGVFAVYRGNKKTVVSGDGGRHEPPKGKNAG